MQTNAQTSRILHRKPEAFGAMGWGNSTGYQKIKDGLFVEPVKTGSMTSVWPSDEIAKIQAAYIAGKSDDEIRRLVAQLHAARKGGE